MLKVVVLPAPLGPSRPTIFAGGNGDGDAVDDAVMAVFFDQPVGGQQCCRWQALAGGWLLDKGSVSGSIVKSGPEAGRDHFRNLFLRQLKLVRIDGRRRAANDVITGGVISFRWPRSITSTLLWTVLLLS